MIDKRHQPTAEEMAVYVNNPIFDKLFAHMQKRYQALYKIEYSGDVWLPGWNLKFRKAGKSLCVIYPKPGFVMVLVVVGAREKPRVEELLPRFSAEMQELYKAAREGNGQRWLLIELHDEGPLYRDVLVLIEVRRERR